MTVAAKLAGGSVGAARIVHLGARIAWRTLFGLWIRGAVLSGLVGAISYGVRLKEGQTSAILFIAVLVPAVLIDTFRRGRTDLARQHRYLSVQAPRPGVRVWRPLVAGQCLTAGIVGLVYYLVAVASHLNAGGITTMLLLSPAFIEMAAWLAVVTHLCSGDTATPSELASYLAGAIVVVTAVVLKGILTYPVSFALGAALSAVSIAVAIVVGSRAPLWAARGLTPPRGAALS